MAEATAAQRRRQRILANGEDRLARITGVTKPQPTAAAIENTETPSSVEPEKATTTQQIEKEDSSSKSETSSLTPAAHFQPREEIIEEIIPPTPTPLSESSSSTQKSSRRSQPSAPRNQSDLVTNQIMYLLDKFLSNDSAESKKSSLPSWLVYSQLFVVITIALAHFLVFWININESSLKIWTYAYSNSFDRTSLDETLGLPLMGLLLTAELFLFALYRFIGPVVNTIPSLPRTGTVLQYVLGIIAIIRSQQDILLKIVSDIALLLFLISAPPLVLNYLIAE